MSPETMSIFSPKLAARFDALIDKYPVRRSALVPMLLFAQDEVGHLSDAVIADIAKRVEVTDLEVRNVISYYSLLHTKPMGKYHVQVCTNICCQAVGGEKLYEHATRTLGIKNKQTTADSLISIEEVECMGACAWAPAIQINYDFHHRVTPERFDQLIGALRDGTYGRKAS